MGRAKRVCDGDLEVGQDVVQHCSDGRFTCCEWLAIYSPSPSPSIPSQGQVFTA
jgi:hypothetical protein